MASSPRGKKDASNESLLEIGLMMGFAFAVIFGLIWFLSSHKIVYYSTPFFRLMGTPWVFFKPEKWTAIQEAYIFFRNQPRSVPLPNFIAFANDCLRPVAFVFGLAAGISLFLRMLSPTSELRRVLEPMRAAKEISKTFPAIIPVLHLGPKLVKNALPLWARQTFPEEIWQKEKINGKSLMEEDTLKLDLVTAYFRGGELKPLFGAPTKFIVRKGRRWSRTLGFNVVNLLTDSKNPGGICFPDRFSPQGKVVFAILCAHAFGGRQGKLDYQKACDEINRTAAGQENGIPNLTSAQWIYDKYRMNQQANLLFAVHHWEFTYLYSLFSKAKRSGKATHTDFIWLKPLDRMMFYGLNTLGRATPHAEAGGVFAQHSYENKCARLKRLPIRTDDDGRMEMNIVVHAAVEGMEKEFIRYQASTEDDDLWWAKTKAWEAGVRYQGGQGALIEQVAEQKRIALALKNVELVDTEYDQLTTKKFDEKQRDEEEAFALKMANSGGSVNPLDSIL